MRLKKTDAANIDKSKHIYIIIGLVLASSFALEWLEWGNYDVNKKYIKSSALALLNDEIIIEYESIEIPELPQQIKQEPNEIIVTPDPPKIIEPIYPIIPIIDSVIIPIVTPVIGKDDLPDFDTIPFEIVSNMPSFPGGETELFRYLSKNISYPEISKIENSQGKVHLSFIVEKDGAISNVHVLLGVDKYIDKEAIRVIEHMPRWIPGEQMGEKVRVRFQLPLNFKLL